MNSVLYILRLFHLSWITGFDALDCIVRFNTGAIRKICSLCHTTAKNANVEPTSSFHRGNADAGSGMVCGDLGINGCTSAITYAECCVVGPDGQLVVVEATSRRDLSPSRPCHRGFSRLDSLHPEAAVVLHSVDVPHVSGVVDGLDACRDDFIPKKLYSENGFDEPSIGVVDWVEFIVVSSLHELTAKLDDGTSGDFMQNVFRGCNWDSSVGGGCWNTGRGEWSTSGSYKVADSFPLKRTKSWALRKIWRFSDIYSLACVCVIFLPSYFPKFDANSAVLV